MACTVSSVTFPLASVSTRPPNIRTASAMSSRLMLSSITRDTALVSTASSSRSAMTTATSSIVRVSTSIFTSSIAFACRYACAFRTAASIDPLAAMWLSLIMIMSNRPMRWFLPPPTSTAHLSGSRSPGTVFRVSSIVAGAAASAIFRVSVAMPDMRCMKLSSTRSARRILCALPRISQKTSPYFTESPSFLVHATVTSGSTAARIWFASAWPASTPSALASSVAVDSVSRGIVLRQLMSPTSAMSSSSAARIASAMLYVGWCGAAIAGGSRAASPARIISDDGAADARLTADEPREVRARRRAGARAADAPRTRVAAADMPRAQRIGGNEAAVSENVLSQTRVWYRYRAFQRFEPSAI